MQTDSLTQNSHSCITDREWRNLLRDIHSGQVLPVIGPELVTVPSSSGEEVNLYRYLAEALADRMGVGLSPDQMPELNAVACAALLSGCSSKDLYDEIRELVDELSSPLPQGLLDLASITDFNLFISTTFDPLMGRVLEQARPGFLLEKNILDFHPSNPKDLPSNMPQPFLYHILGTHDTYPYFAVWEEDDIEYMCGLLAAQDNLRVLFEQLRNRDLLLMGSPFSDWIVRLFLRVAKGKRFSEPRDHGRLDYVAQDPGTIPQPTIFFYEQNVGSTRIIPGHPKAFVSELAQQWRDRYGGNTSEDFMQHMASELPRGAVFISYSRDDLTAATELARGLQAAQIPVWMDQGRLSAGENYNRGLEHAVKNDAGYFIALISEATEKDPDRYVHQERAWAAQRHVDGFVFYIPVLIDDLKEVNQEPPVFDAIHRELLPQGRVTPGFAKRMQALVREYRQSGQPRG